MTSIAEPASTGLKEAHAAHPPSVDAALPPRRRLEFLDALRGLAAAYVVVYHMVLLPQPALAAPRWAEKVALAGGTGVTLFFIVSAFSLYYTMPLRLKEPSPTFSFYLHRFFRIAPLFYFLLAATLVRDAFFFHASHSTFDIATSLGLVFNLVPTRQEGIVWASWTIGVEMMFYAVFPLIYARFKSTGNAIALVFACLLAWMAIQLALDYAVMPEAWKKSILQWSTFRHFPIFAMGIVIYQAWMSLDAERVETGGYRSAGNALVLGGVFGFTTLLQGWLPNLFGDSYYWQGLVFGCLFMGLALSPWKPVVNECTRYLGKISYSIYLNHTTAVFFLIPVYRWLYANTGSLTLGFASSLAVTFAIVIPISALTYHIVEEPGIALGKKVATRIRNRAGAKRP